MWLPYAKWVAKITAVQTQAHSEAISGLEITGAEISPSVPRAENKTEEG